MALIDASRDKQVWNSAKVTKVYASVDQLQKPEQAILNILKDRLPYMRMLDLGIGGGRTTVHFAPLAGEYVGSDYAENMVDACIKRFPNPGANVRFEVIDATDMKGVPDQSFDFVLFSFNSIDCVAPEDREKVFREVQRVGKKGGYFAFSTHNLRYLSHMYALKWHKRWQDLLYQFYRTARLIFHNGFPGKYQNHDWAIIRNGIEHFSLNIYYIKPERQIEILKKNGFKNIRAFSRKTGEEIPHDLLPLVKREAWIHFLCEI